MLNKTVLIFFLLTSTAYAGDFVCWDNNDNVVSLHKSVDSLDYVNRTDCKKITRSQLESINTRLYKHSSGDIVAKSQAELDVEALAEATAQAQAEATRLSNLDNDLIKNRNITLTKVDNVIDNIGNLQDAKVFLKRLVRYIASIDTE